MATQRDDISTKPIHISKQIRKYLDDTEDIDMDLLKDMIGNHFEDIYDRKMMKMHLRKYLNDEEVEELLPVRKGGNRRTHKSVESIILTLVKTEYNGNNLQQVVDKVVKYVDNNSKSANGMLSQITRIRKMLISNDYEDIADKLLASNLYKKAKDDAKYEMEESLIDREEITYDIPEFKRDNLLKSLDKLVNNIVNDSNYPINYEIITLALLNFAARPSELYYLQLNNGKISGHLKQRGKNSLFPYEGILPYDKAVILLSYIKKHDEYNFDYRLDSHKIDAYRRYLKDKYGITPRVLRKLGSLAAISDESSTIKRILKQKNVLRHQSEATSVLHYQNGGI